MRWAALLNAVALLWTALVLVVVANPIKEDSITTIDITERLACDGSHFIVSVQRTDDVRQDSGELIAEKSDNIVFDFRIDREAETLLINGYALKLVPQQIRRLSLLAAVIPPDHPAMPSNIITTSQIKSPEVLDALNKLERNGLVTADVDLFVTYDGDNRVLGLKVQVTEVEGKEVIHKDLLKALIATPRNTLPHPGPAELPPPPPQRDSCAPSDWKCRFISWLKGITGHKPCAGNRHHRPHPLPGAEESGHRGNGDYYRHRFHRPRRGFMRFIIHVVVPVIIGAAAGVGIGILSVLVAEIVGGIVLRIRGRRGAEYREISGDEKELVEEEELPLYEEGEPVPEYIDTEVKKVQQ